MNITCNYCNKKFNIDSSLIPEKGRLLQCSACNHKWFFKNATIKKIPSIKTDIFTEKKNTVQENSIRIKTEGLENIEPLNKKDKDILVNKKIAKYKKNDYKILGSIVIFTVSFVALIIILDTFQNPISKIVPNIEFLLYNLYETINDVRLFLKDLI